MIDGRLLIGVVLVLASVAGVVALVGSADRRVTVYAAATTIAPGMRIDSGDLVLRSIALDDARALYLTSADIPAGGLVATNVVRRGELVPRSAVGSEEGTDSTSLVLQLAGQVSQSVVAGATVDVWSSASTTSLDEVAGEGGFGPPIVIAADAVVVRLVDDDGFVSAGDGQSVEVLVPRSQVARLLQAIADGDALAVVPAGIPLGSR